MAMNSIARAIASELSLYTHSSRKCLVAALQQSLPHCYYFTTTTNTPKSTASPPRVSGPKPQQKSEEKPETLKPTQWSYFSRESKPQSREYPRPVEIPWQAKVANSVNLIGHVQSPVQFQVTPDRKYYAGTVLVCQSIDGLTFPFPVVFEGDLAQVAFCHLNEKDHIYVVGGLRIDSLPFSSALKNGGGAYVHILASSFNFVRGNACERKPSEEIHKLVELDGSVIHSEDADSFINHPFKEISVGKGNLGAEPATEHKDKVTKEMAKQEGWRDLVRNPKEWLDYRDYKLNGSVKAKFPDFKHKGTGTGIWLDTAPAWVHQELDGLEFDRKSSNPNAPTSRSTHKTRKEESWKSLVDNPDKWWDNRLDKISPKGPDFKGKDSGEALWLKYAPDWVLPKLPPLKAK